MRDKKNKIIKKLKYQLKSIKSMFLIEIQDPDDEVNRYGKLKGIRKIIRT